MATILSIDDDPGLQDLVSYVLQARGHKVEWAFRGEEGLEKAQKLKPDLIILDLMLPTLNGAEVLRLLKLDERLREIPVIVVTAFYEEAPFKEAVILAMGAARFVKKPVPNDQLVALVEELLPTPVKLPS